MKATKKSANPVKVLVTGANGFLGGALVREFASRGFSVFAGVRDISLSSYPANAIPVNLGDISNSFDLRHVLGQVDVVVHCAARVHIFADHSADPLSDFRDVNVTATLKIAQQAADAGVKRFVFISTVKVNGESTSMNTAFDEFMDADPKDAYSVTKYEAELGVRHISLATGMEFVVVRPPLVYGPGVKGNFYNLLKLAKCGVPLPFGSISNKRSMVYLGNLVDFVIRCVEHPYAANQTFFVSDNNDLGTADLIRMLRRLFGVPVRLLPFPVAILYFASVLLGKYSMAERLFGSLQISCHKAMDTLEWSPPVSVEHGLGETVASFLQG